MYELGYSAKRRERRKRALLLAAGGLGIFALGLGSGWALHQPTFVPVPGGSPTPCITLAVIPSDILPKPYKVTVNVLNGSRRVGMANITAEVLRTRKFKIGEVGNFEGTDVEIAGEIHYGPEGAKSAQLLAAFFEGVELVEDSRVDASVDLVIGQAFDGVLTREQADEVLHRPIASPSGPGC